MVVDGGEKFGAELVGGEEEGGGGEEVGVGESFEGAAVCLAGAVLVWHGEGEGGGGEVGVDFVAEFSGEGEERCMWGGRDVYDGFM